MSLKFDLKRYDLFGWDYEGVSPLTDAEVNWYKMWARRTDGPLLGLACDTGRLLCRLAEAGFDVVGLDLSGRMLALARGHITRLQPNVQRRIRVVKRNMTDFDLHRKFGLIFIADNSFREQKTRRELLACLKCIQRHLKPGGRLLITERRLDPSKFTDGVWTFGWSEPQQHPDSGEMVCRKGQVRLSKDGRGASGRFVYKTIYHNGTETIEEYPWSAPVLQKEEYVRLFARAGFDTQVFAGYKEVEDDGPDRILCFVCQAKDRVHGST